MAERKMSTNFQTFIQTNKQHEIYRQTFKAQRRNKSRDKYSVKNYQILYEHNNKSKGHKPIEHGKNITSQLTKGKTEQVQH